eukprot:gene2800-biopygen11675
MSQGGCSLPESALREKKKKKEKGGREAASGIRQEVE